MGRIPHLYKKLMDLAHQIADYDLNHEIPRGELSRDIASRFRITRNDVNVALKEFEQRKQYDHLSDRKKIRLRR